MSQASTKKLPLTEGPLFWRIILFALPIMATGVLQILYNMADNIVVGQFSGNPNALGSVGSTSSLTNLIVNLLLGIAAGTSVVVAQAFGAKQDKVVSRAIHTALIFSLVGGLIFMGIGLGVSRPALELMKTRPELLDGAVLYFRIICLGIPATAVYNFGAAILRSVGDSKTPLIILSSTGLINVGLNFFFILVCDMSVDGVAIATIVSQYLSAISVVTVLWLQRNKSYGFSFKKLCFDFALLKRILRFGIPSGIQSSLFSISNIILTSGINSLGDHVIKAYTISNNIDAITYTSCNSFHHAALTFTGQNFGAKKYDRIKRVMIYSLAQVLFFGIAIAQLELLFCNELASLYIDANDVYKEEIMGYARDMMKVLLNTYFLCGIMDVFSGILKGLGYSLAPMIMSLSGICALRIFWVFVVFPLEKFNTHTGLCLSYPLSWTVTALMFLVTLVIVWHKIKRRDKLEESMKISE
ncbi:MAG: MATE family efflux transporter [Clostridia bacterium]|nr:MATE family efflux transporter [Clostridia bacterium]